MENLEEIKKEILFSVEKILNKEQNRGIITGYPGILKDLLENSYKAFSAGRKQGISEAEGVVPEKDSDTNDDNDFVAGFAEGYNRCRQKTLDNIAKLKGKE